MRRSRVRVPLSACANYKRCNRKNAILDLRARTQGEDGVFSVIARQRDIRRFLRPLCGQVLFTERPKKLSDDATLVARASEATLVARASEATLVARASEATFVARASEATLVVRASGNACSSRKRGKRQREQSAQAECE